MIKINIKFEFSIAAIR